MMLHVLPPHDWHLVTLYLSGGFSRLNSSYKGHKPSSSLFFSSSALVSAKYLMKKGQTLTAFASSAVDIVRFGEVNIFKA